MHTIIYLYVLDTVSNTKVIYYANSLVHSEELVLHSRRRDQDDWSGKKKAPCVVHVDNQPNYPRLLCISVLLSSPNCISFHTEAYRIKDHRQLNKEIMLLVSKKLIVYTYSNLSNSGLRSTKYPLAPAINTTFYTT